MATMTDLLTTKQVQALLKVDRTTIYRMVEGRELPAVRVGKQWRFERAQVERWLQLHHRPARPAGEMRAETSAPADRSASDGGLPDLLAQPCVQAMQDAYADLLGVTMVITDMQGRPITGISNPCGFFTTLLKERPEGLQHCIRTWEVMAGHVAMEPKFAVSEMGLLCARGLIRVGAELKGMVVAGGIAPDAWPPSPEQVLTLSKLFGASPDAVAVASDDVFCMDRAAQDRTLRYVQRVADVLAQMIQDCRHPATD